MKLKKQVRVFTLTKGTIHEGTQDGNKNPRKKGVMWMQVS
jgi:hypothetical protein